MHREYNRMQRDIVSGRLLCSKDEAATLAALQIRLEAWPEENLDLLEGKLPGQEVRKGVHCPILRFAEDKLDTLRVTMNDSISRTSTAATSGFNSTTPSRHEPYRRSMMKFRLADVSCCKRVQYNAHQSGKPFLPSNYRHSNEILKLIKVSSGEKSNDR